VPERPLRRLVQLVVSCAVLGAGVGMLLDARLGSDGYSMFVNGIAISSGQDFWVVNLVVGVALVLMAWLRGRLPGVGTVLQPVVVGFVVSLMLDVLPGPASYGTRWLEFVAGFAVVCLGVAGYLAADLGAGPTEAAALAWDPPVPFRWSYTVVQLVGASVGWLLGASIGLGTLLVIAFIGPVVARLLPLFAPPGVPAAQPGM
jgi:uncharacterized membrane protein YczE